MTISLNTNFIFGNNFSVLFLPNERADSGKETRLAVTDQKLLYEIWESGNRISVVDLTNVQRFDLDNSFSVPVAETDICYATKVGRSVELKLTVRFENDISPGETIMVLPEPIRPAYYQKPPIMAVWGNNDEFRIQTIVILNNGIVASDTGFCAGKWNFIQCGYHTNYDAS